jgi:hypothetical protein
LGGDNTNANREVLGKITGNRILVGQRRRYEGAVDEKEKL